MKVIDGTRTIEIPDGDPLVAKIRALLYAQPGAEEPIKALWSNASAPLREVLTVIAQHGEISQLDLEDQLGVSGIGLRGRTAALARIAKRLGAEYPVRQTGGRREHRQFSLDPDTANEVLGLAATRKTRERRKP